MGQVTKTGKGRRNQRLRTLRVLQAPLDWIEKVTRQWFQCLAMSRTLEHGIHVGAVIDLSPKKKCMGKNLTNISIQVANTCMKRSSTSYVIRDLQSKTAMRCHHSPVRTAEIQDMDNTKCWGGWEATELSLLLAMQNGTLVLEDSLTVS